VKIRALAALALAAVLALGGCGGDSSPAPVTSAAKPGTGKTPIRLATKNFTEQFILGQLYAQALEAKGFRVALKDNVGTSEIVDRVLTGGGVDVYPEYTGVIVQELAKENRRPRSADETYRRARAFEQMRGATIFKPSPGQNVLANGVLPEFARKHGLKSTADLRKLRSFTYGGPPENVTRFQGLVGMKKEYGLTQARYVCRSGSSSATPGSTAGRPTWWACSRRTARSRRRASTSCSQTRRASSASRTSCRW
jgi:osmoprotectant transport system substrate-binding protein